MGGLVIFPCPGKNLIFKIFCKDTGLVIFPCPGWIQNLKFSVRVGVSHFSISRQNLKFRCFSEGWGVGHLTMFRSNLKLKFLVMVGGQSSFLVQAKSEIYIVWWGTGLVIFPCPGQIWNLKCLVRLGISHLSMSRSNLKFKHFLWEFGVGHISISRSNLKYKTFSEGGGQSFFHI